MFHSRLPCMFHTPAEPLIRTCPMSRELETLSSTLSHTFLNFRQFRQSGATKAADKVAEAMVLGQPLVNAGTGSNTRIRWTLSGQLLCLTLYRNDHAGPLRNSRC